MPEVTLQEFGGKVEKFLRKGWTQGQYALTKIGAKCAWDSKSACKWCLYGAYFAAIHAMGAHHVRYEFQNNLNAIIGMNWPDWNDAKGRKKSEVIAAVREAAGLEEPCATS